MKNEFRVQAEKRYGKVPPVGFEEVLGTYYGKSFVAEDLVKDSVTPDLLVAKSYVYWGQRTNFLVYDTFSRMYHFSSHV